MDNDLCPYGVYVLKCQKYPECVCGRHIARAKENSEQLEEKRRRMHSQSDASTRKS